MPAWCFTLVVMAGLTGGAVAQDDVAGKAKGWLRILPVGDAPPFRQSKRARRFGH